MRTIQPMEEKFLLPSLALVEQVFTDHESEEEGKMVCGLVEEIRSKKYYLPTMALFRVRSCICPLSNV